VIRMIACSVIDLPRSVPPHLRAIPALVSMSRKVG
jgi:hypothetical protein